MDSRLKGTLARLIALLARVEHIYLFGSIWSKVERKHKTKKQLNGFER